MATFAEEETPLARVSQAVARPAVASARVPLVPAALPHVPNPLWAVFLTVGPLRRSARALGHGIAVGGVLRRAVGLVRVSMIRRFCTGGPLSVPGAACAMPSFPAARGSSGSRRAGSCSAVPAAAGSCAGACGRAFVGAVPLVGVEPPVGVRLLLRNLYPLVELPRPKQDGAHLKAAGVPVMRVVGPGRRAFDRQGASHVAAAGGARSEVAAHVPPRSRECYRRSGPAAGLPRPWLHALRNGACGRSKVAAVEELALPFRFAAPFLARPGEPPPP